MRKLRNTGLARGMTGRKAIAVGMFVNRWAPFMACLLLLVFMTPTVANAVGPTQPPASADTLWTTFTDLIGKWIARLGGVIVLIGAVMFGLGWKSDDAEQKSRGVSTVIAGAIVVAAASAADRFLNVTP